MAGIKPRYDVVVVGAGPGGSLCARDLAERGYHVLLVEKRPVIGVPVRCGEATGRRTRLADFVRVNEATIETDIHGVMVHTRELDIRYDQADVGLMLNRELFDQDIARQAEEAGAQVEVECRVFDVLPAGEGGRSVRLMVAEREEIQVEAAMVVAADGVESLCGQWAGLKSRQHAPHVCSAIELRLAATDEHPNHLSFWINWPGIRKGYVWVFPKVKSGVLNVGAGTITPRPKDPNVYRVAKDFAAKFFPEAEVLDVNGGAVPVSGNLKEFSADRFLLVGDAAHHTNPLTGGGIASALYAGQIAARWIHRGFETGDLSAGFFRQYEADCWKRFGNYHRKQTRIRDFILGLPHPEEVRFFRTLKSMVEGRPSLATKAAGYAGLGGLLLRNWKLARKVMRNTPAHRGY